MIRLPAFRYFAPRTLDEAIALLRDHGPDAMPVAGGTDLFPNMKRRQIEPTVLVGLRGIADLAGIRGSAADALRIGALTPISAIAASPEIAAAFPALATAAGLVACVPTPAARSSTSRITGGDRSGSASRRTGTRASWLRAARAAGRCLRRIWPPSCAAWAPRLC